jgi:AraC family transcriptional regulator of adaptative response / methylphosphotriester-DNA alkyltransferase methyltransferase
VRRGKPGNDHPELHLENRQDLPGGPRYSAVNNSGEADSIMKLTDDEMWQAVVDGDKSHDGKFFYGVKTVGVYCRPSCKSRTPLRRNVLYFEQPEDAEKAAFRPCKRCRPDLPVHDPALEIVRQTKEWLEAHYHERKHLAEKMKQSGVTVSHLAVIFRRQYGMSPGQYLNRLRAGQAKENLAQTDRPIIDIAGELGFESLSAFYRFFKKQAGTTPRQYRVQITEKRER